ncbi:unnamed protein product [Rotaria sordida]|nr:unnamed protein product [Rotaria sordida]
MRFAILFGAVFAAGVLDGILVYGISHMKDIGGLKNWRWLFLLEGLPIIPLGVMTYLFLGSIPDTVQCMGQMGGAIAPLGHPTALLKEWNELHSGTNAQTR